MIDKLSDSWICETHSKAMISNWVNNLKYFYYKRAWGGHANDGDEFIAHIDFENDDDLMSKLIALGIEIKKIPNDFPRPIVGKTYAGDEYSKFKPEIAKLKIEQPCHTSIFGVKCFVYVSRGIEIKISGGLDGNLYEVSDVDFENCKLLESGFEKAGIKPYRDSMYESNILYISKLLYSDYYK